MSALETEVKFRVSHPEHLERRLVSSGFHQETARTFERNVLFDTPDRRLRAEHQILRIRQYGESWVLTHKALPPGGDDGPYKHRVETETTLGDGDTLAAIFATLGLTPAFTYEKWRTVWADEAGHCVVDETPIGLYAELEGPEQWIDEKAAALGVPSSEFLNLSYGRLLDLWNLETGNSVNDLTFAAIESASASIVR